jgi:hypothetical protein
LGLAAHVEKVGVPPIHETFSALIDESARLGGDLVLPAQATTDGSRLTLLKEFGDAKDGIPTAIGADSKRGAVYSRGYFQANGNEVRIPGGVTEIDAELLHQIETPEDLGVWTGAFETQRRALEERRAAAERTGQERQERIAQLNQSVVTTIKRQPGTGYGRPEL